MLALLGALTFIPKTYINTEHEKFKYYIIILIISVLSIPISIYAIPKHTLGTVHYEIFFSLAVYCICLIILFLDVNIRSFTFKLAGIILGGNATFKTIRTYYSFTYSLMIYRIIFIMMISIIGFNSEIRIISIHIFFEFSSVILIFIITKQIQKFSNVKTIVSVVIYTLFNLIFYALISLMIFAITYIVTKSIQNSKYEQSYIGKRIDYNPGSRIYEKCINGDCINGQGIAKYKLSNQYLVYTGSFKESKPDGYGEMKISEDETIQGVD